MSWLDVYKSLLRADAIVTYLKYQTQDRVFYMYYIIIHIPSCAKNN